jgi:hypothetical protein
VSGISSRLLATPAEYRLNGRQTGGIATPPLAARARLPSTAPHRAPYESPARQCTATPTACTSTRTTKARAAATIPRGRDTTGNHKNSYAGDSCIQFPASRGIGERPPGAEPLARPINRRAYRCHGYTVGTQLTADPDRPITLTFSVQIPSLTSVRAIKARAQLVTQCWLEWSSPSSAMRAERLSARSRDCAAKQRSSIPPISEMPYSRCTEFHKSMPCSPSLRGGGGTVDADPTTVSGGLFVSLDIIFFPLRHFATNGFT